ncbi:MAG: TetR family transcriptional regulator C-terminal domain-containing protein [Methylocystis sp.]
MSRRTVNELKGKLLDEGVSLLLDRGYHGSGLQELVQKVGVPKGSFYNYFDSKDAFGAEVVGHYLEPFIRQLDVHLNRSDLSAKEALRAYLDALIAQLEHRDFHGGCLLGNLIGEIGESSGLCQDALRAGVHRYRDKLREALARGQREGDFRADRDAAAMADFLLDAWQGALLRMKIERSVAPLVRCRDLLLDDLFKD